MNAPETQVPIAGRTLPMSVVGALYESIRESLDIETSRDATALWNAIVRADKKSKGIAVDGPFPGERFITAERLDELLKAYGSSQDLAPVASAKLERVA